MSAKAEPKAETLLEILVDKVFDKRETGRLEEICNRRASFYLPGARRLYSVSLMEEIVPFLFPDSKGRTVEIADLVKGSPELDSPQDLKTNSAAAYIRCKPGVREGIKEERESFEGLLFVRSARGRIQSIRLETNMYMGVISYKDASQAISVSPIPRSVALPPISIYEEELTEVLSRYSAYLAGRPIAEHFYPSSELNRHILLGASGSLFIDEIVGEKTRKENTRKNAYRLALAWYKGVVFFPPRDFTYRAYTPSATAQSEVEMDAAESAEEIDAAQSAVGLDTADRSVGSEVTMSGLSSLDIEDGEVTRELCFFDERTSSELSGAFYPDKTLGKN